MWISARSKPARDRGENWLVSDPVAEHTTSRVPFLNTNAVFRERGTATNAARCGHRNIFVIERRHCLKRRRPKC